MAEKTTATTLSIQLALVQFQIDRVLQLVDRIFSLLGLEVTTTYYMEHPDDLWDEITPQSQEELTATLDQTAAISDDDPIHAEAIAISVLFVAAGPTIYTRLPHRAMRWFDFGTARVLKSHKALLHPATGYILGCRSVLVSTCDFSYGLHHLIP